VTRELDAKIAEKKGCNAYPNRIIDARIAKAKGLKIRWLDIDPWDAKLQYLKGYDDGRAVWYEVPWWHLRIQEATELWNEMAAYTKQRASECEMGDDWRVELSQGPFRYWFKGLSALIDKGKRSRTVWIIGGGDTKELAICNAWLEWRQDELYQTTD